MQFRFEKYRNYIHLYLMPCFDWLEMKIGAHICYTNVPEQAAFQVAKILVYIFSRYLKKLSRLLTPIATCVFDFLILRPRCHWKYNIYWFSFRFFFSQMFMCFCDFWTYSWSCLTDSQQLIKEERNQVM